MPQTTTRTRTPPSSPLALLLLLFAAILPTPPTATTPAAWEPPGLSAIFPEPKVRARYLRALHKLSMHEVSTWRLAQRAKLTDRAAEVRAALRADPRYERVHEPGPERYRLRVEHRHAWTLQGAKA